MKIELKALCDAEFKAPVYARIPLMDVDSEGKTQYGDLFFIGRFKTIPVNQVRKHMDQYNQLKKEGKDMEAIQLSSQQIEEYFIGFEPMPGKELPFLDNGQPMASTPDNVKAILDSREVREAVNIAYNQARDKALEGNS